MLRRRFIELFALAQEDPVIIDTTLEVLLHVTVLDKNGHLITTLDRHAFTVLENGIPQTLTLFKRADLPVSLGIVIDKCSKVASATLTLVKESNPENEVFIVNFSAASMSMDYLKEKGRKAKKVLLVITEGEDNTRAVANTLEKLVLEAQQSQSLVYAIGIFTGEERGKAKRAERALSALANATAGHAYFPKQLTDIGTLARQVAHELRNQYIVAYRPSNEALDNTYRRIQVVAKGANHPVVRTRSGYYATPDVKEVTRLR